MKMKFWEARPFTIALKPGVDPRLSEVNGIVVQDLIGIHRDSLSGVLILTELKSGKKFQNSFFDIMLAVREAQRLTTEGWPLNEVE